MIGKGKSIQHTSNAINYALKKEGAEILGMANLSGDTAKEMANQMKVFQNLNNRTTNKTISFVLSPDIKDGKRLSDQELIKIAGQFMKEMDLHRHQGVLIKHTDKKHKHLHMFINRIDSNGKAYNDSYISKKAQRKADIVAKRNNLTRAKLVEEEKKTNTKEIRAEIHRRHKVAMKHRPSNFNEYRQLMKGNGVDIEPTITRKGKLQGYRLKFDGKDFKASEIHRSMTLSRMSRTKEFSGTNPELKQEQQRRNKGYTR